MFCQLYKPFKTFLSPRSISPLFGFIKPQINSTKVDFPTPDGPDIKITSEFLIVRLRLLIIILSL